MSDITHPDPDRNPNPPWDEEPDESAESETPERDPIRPPEPGDAPEDHQLQIEADTRAVIEDANRFRSLCRIAVGHLSYGDFGRANQHLKNQTAILMAMEGRLQSLRKRFSELVEISKYWESESE